MNINNCAEHPYIKIQRGRNGQKWTVELGNDNGENMSIDCNKVQAMRIAQAVIDCIEAPNRRERKAAEKNEKENNHNYS